MIEEAKQIADENKISLEAAIQLMHIHALNEYKDIVDKTTDHMYVINRYNELAEEHGYVIHRYNELVGDQ